MTNQTTPPFITLSFSSPLSPMFGPNIPVIAKLTLDIYWLQGVTFCKSMGDTSCVGNLHLEITRRFRCLERKREKCNNFIMSARRKVKYSPENMRE